VAALVAWRYAAGCRRRNELSNQEHYRKLERMYASATVNDYYSPRMRISEGQAEVIIPIRPDLFHAAGAVHGLVYFKALDDAAFFAVNSLVEDVFVLTASFNLYLTRPISKGELKATGRVVHGSRRFFVAESVAVNSDGQEVARGSGTFLPSSIPLSPKVGYE
jgi:uncharacterized protein (TIGR00369 family)